MPPQMMAHMMGHAPSQSIGGGKSWIFGLLLLLLLAAVVFYFMNKRGAAKSYFF